MTEEEWQTASDPEPMLRFLRGKTSNRKLGLFASGCCRLVWRHFNGESQQAVELRERYEDGEASNPEMASMIRKALTLRSQLRHLVGMGDEITPESVPAWIADLAFNVANGIYFPVASTVARIACCQCSHPGQCEATIKAIELCPMLRDIFGNPFRSVTLNASWLTSIVLTLAYGIYTDKAFDRMPILADALQDAGCESDDILKHCRSDGPHVRGCFVVDLLLGKE